LEVIALAEPVTLRRATATSAAANTNLADIAGLERASLVAIDAASDDIHVAHPLYGEVLRASLPYARLHHHAAGLANLPAEGRPERRVRAVRWKIEAGIDVPASELLDAAEIAHHREDLRVSVKLARRAFSDEPVRTGRVLGMTLDQLGDTEGAFEALDAAAA